MPTDNLDQKVPEKLTFEEWYSKLSVLEIPELEEVRHWRYQAILEAAQENK